MGRVGRALLWHEFRERTRDRWVIAISILFALLASAVGVYGRGAEAEVAKLAGPSLVTLTSLLVPLVALVLAQEAIAGERERNTLGLLLSLPVRRSEVVIAKFAGRAIALAVAVALGMGAAMLAAGPEQADALLGLIGPTLLLGSAFLALGLLISTAASRQAAAASAVVIAWFALVFFYDLGLLGLLVLTDGGISDAWISRLVVANPSGLYRLQMMQVFTGSDGLAELGLAAALPSKEGIAALWLAWVALPVAASSLLLERRRVVS